MRIVFWGTPNFSIDILNELLLSNHEVVAVITQPDRRRGRGSKLIPSPVKKRAIEHSITVLTPHNIRCEPNYLNELSSFKPDLFIVVAFGQILPIEILEIPKFGSWNIHASLLPKWRGAAPIQRSIFNGDNTTGASVMLMEEGLDTGPILIEKTIKIHLLDNCADISNQLSKLSAELIIEAIHIFENVQSKSDKDFIKGLCLTEQKQLHRPVLYAQQISKKELHIDWTLSALTIHRTIMAFYPNAYTIFASNRIKLSRSIPLEKELKQSIPIDYYPLVDLFSNKSNSKSGIILSIIPKKGFIVSTSSCPLLILEGQLEGKKTVSADILVEQLRLRVGAQLD